MDNIKKRKGVIIRDDDIEIRKRDYPVDAKITLNVDDEHKDYITDFIKTCAAVFQTKGKLAISVETRIDYYTISFGLEIVHWKEVSQILDIFLLGSGSVMSTADNGIVLLHIIINKSHIK